MFNHFTKGQIIEKKIISSIIDGSPSLVWAKVKLLKPANKPFKAGQFITFRVEEGVFRAYSIASSSHNDSEYEVIVSVSHNGVGSNYFKNINIGDEVDFLGPNGHFFIKYPACEKIYFYATGTGIAPFLPMIEEMFENSQKEVYFFHGIKDESNLDYYLSFHHQMKEKYGNLYHYQIFVSRPHLNSPKHLGYTQGRITNAIKELDNFENKDFYLCGHPDMVDEIASFLKSKNVSDENINAEYFTSPGANNNL